MVEGLALILSIVAFFYAIRATRSEPDTAAGIENLRDEFRRTRTRVPFVRFFGNCFPGYHEAGDTPDQLDPAQVQRMARLCFATAWILANP